MKTRHDIEQLAKTVCPSCRDSIGVLVRGVDDQGAEWWHQKTPDSGCYCLASDIREGRKLAPNANYTPKDQ